MEETKNVKRLRCRLHCVEIMLWFVFLTCRTMPLAIYIGVSIVTVCYLLVNISFFAVLTYEQIESVKAVALVSL